MRDNTSIRIWRIAGPWIVVMQRMIMVMMVVVLREIVMVVYGLISSGIGIGFNL